MEFGQGSWAGEEWRKKEKKNEREKRRRWLGSTASGGRCGLELGREDEGLGLGWRGGGKEKKNLKRRR